MTKLRRFNAAHPWLITGLLTCVLVTAQAGCDRAKPKASLALGPEHSASHQVSQHLLGAYGINQQKVSLHTGRFEGALEGLKKGQIDIAMGFFGLPSRNVESLQAATGDLKLLSMPEALLDTFEKESGYQRVTIAKHSYPFMSQDISTLAAHAVLMANTHTVSNELAYQVAKVMYEQGGGIPHEQAQFLSLSHALDGAKQLRIHPGAKRFYEEQGLTVMLPVADLALSRNKREFILGSGSQGGTYYPLGNELAALWNRAIPSINITSVATDASLENLTGLAEQKLDFSMALNTSALDAQTGTGHFAPTAINNAAFIGQLYPEVFHIITRSSNALSTFEQVQAR